MNVALDLIPFNRAYRSGREAEYIGQSLEGGLTSGDGPFTARASELLSQRVGGRRVLLTTSCTAALEMSALLLDLQPGDEVIMPSFTFVSTANAFALRGAVPVFVDIRDDTLNLDERLVEAAVTERTKAVVVVHYAGVACAMDEILDVARRHGLAVVEDNAHGLGGSYRDRPLGSLGVMATQSFHVTKNIQCGEGGALILDDGPLMERAEILREKGTNRSQFFRGMVDKYRWVDLGSSYLPSDLLAAHLTAQLERFDEIQRQRQEVWRAYDERLAGWAVDQGVMQPVVPDRIEHPAHMYQVVLPHEVDQAGLIDHLKAEGVMAVFHYVPLHESPAAQRLGRVGAGGCEVTSSVSRRLVRLPLFAGMSERELDHIVSSVGRYRTSA